MSERTLGNALAGLDAKPPPENFPVASPLLPAGLRQPIAILYRCLRLADDIADSPQLDRDTKLAALEELESAVALGTGPEWAERGHALHHTLAAHRLSAEPVHRLFAAFKRDTTGICCQSWADLMGYCRLSAEPVAELALAFARAPEGAYAPARSVAAAFQVLDHLQDLGEDYRLRGRVYLPADWLTEHGGSVADLAGTSSSAAVSAAKRRALAGVRLLLAQGESLPRQLRGSRLGLESRVVIALGNRLRRKLAVSDPLVRKPALNGPEAAWTSLYALVGGRLR